MLSSNRASPLKGPIKGLLGKQLASITDTLSKASKRRDTEIQKRISRDSTPAASLATTPILRARASTNDVQPTECGSLSIIRDVREGNLVRKDLGSEGSTLGMGCTYSTKVAAELESPEVSLRKGETLDWEDDDLDRLRVNITKMLSQVRGDEAVEVSVGFPPTFPKFDLSSEPKEAQFARETRPLLDKVYIPYALALQLERVGCKWETVNGWMAYLFSDGMESNKGTEEKDRVVERAAKDLDAIIESTLKEESTHQAAEEMARLPYRLILSNIAADADEEEVLLLFSDYRFDIREFKFLEEREPIKKTRVAHLDMWTRMSAEGASRTIAHIYGLLLYVRLAVENAG